jgi:hypothetical protein
LTDMQNMCDMNILPKATQKVYECPAQSAINDSCVTYGGLTV